MSFQHPDDPRQLVEHWVLRKCAKVRREGPDEAEFIGLLLFEPEVGSPLVLALDEQRRLTTSPVRRIDPGPNDTVYADTANNRYWIRRLWQLRETR